MGRHDKNRRKVHLRKVKTRKKQANRSKTSKDLDTAARTDNSSLVSDSNQSSLDCDDSIESSSLDLDSFSESNDSFINDRIYKEILREKCKRYSNSIDNKKPNASSIPSISNTTNKSSYKEDPLYIGLKNYVQCKEKLRCLETKYGKVK